MPTHHSRKRAPFTLSALGLCISMASLGAAPLMAADQLPTGSASQSNKAQQQSQSYNLPAGSLASSLNAVARQANLTLSVDPTLVENKTAPAVSGNYSVQQVLQQLLIGTGIQFSHSGTTVTLVKSDNDVMTLSPVKVGAVADDNISAVGTSVAVSYKGLQRIQPNDLKSIFSSEPSVSVGGSIPMNQKLYLRGIEETALSVTIDGARQNNRIFHHSATTLIDPSLLKSVRASAGVSPADDGPGAIGGSIAFETIDVADVLATDDSFGGFVNASYDSNSKTMTTAASLYGQQQGFEALAFINRASGDDYEDGNGDTVNYSEADLFSGLAKIAYETESGDRFELSYENVTDDAVRPYRANFGGLTAGRPTPESREYDLTRTNIVFNYNNQTDSGFWNPNIVIADSETELVTTETPLSDPSSSIAYTGITESQSLVAENLFITDFANITAGFDYYDESVEFLYSGDPDIVEEAENLGLFVQFRQEFNALNLSYGLRYDQQDFTGTDESNSDDNGISGNIFAEFIVSDYLTLTAGYASVWGGIALAESFILNQNWDYSEGVDPVESDNYVIGIESTINDFSFGVNAYKTDITNGRTPSWRAGPHITADFKITGYDLFASYETPTNSLSLKYSNIDADKDGETASSYDGNYFTSPLGELITLSATKSFEQLPLVLGLNTEISLDNDDVEGNGAKQEGYTVVDLFADYLILDNLNLRLAINNITDEEYADRATYGQEFVTVKPLLEPGRSFMLSARYQF